MRYAVNFGIDRPITRILFRYTHPRNYGKLPGGELLRFTKSEIIPFLRSIDTAQANAKLRSVRHVRYLLLTYGARAGLAYCYVYSILRLIVFPLWRLPRGVVRRLRAAVR